LFLIPELSTQIIYFSIVAFWLFLIVIFVILCNRYEVDRKIENFALSYKMSKLEETKDGKKSPYVTSACESGFFSLVLTLVTYIYIPIIRDSISTAFFNIEQ
jgi:hypothetical protein